MDKIIMLLKSRLGTKLKIDKDSTYISLKAKIDDENAVRELYIIVRELMTDKGWEDITEE